MRLQEPGAAGPSRRTHRRAPRLCERNRSASIAVAHLVPRTSAMLDRRGAGRPGCCPAPDSSGRAGLRRDASLTESDRATSTTATIALLLPLASATQRRRTARRDAGRRRLDERALLRSIVLTRALGMSAAWRGSALGSAAPVGRRVYGVGAPGDGRGNLFGVRGLALVSSSDARCAAARLGRCVLRRCRGQPASWPVATAAVVGVCAWCVHAVVSGPVSCLVVAGFWSAVG